MSAPICTDCGRPVLDTGFRVNLRDQNSVAVCRSCRGRRGGRAYSAKAEAHRVGRLIDVALAAREKGASR